MMSKTSPPSVPTKLFHRNSVSNVSKEEQIWRLFTSYAMFSSSKEFEYLRVTQLRKMLTECEVFSLQPQEGKVSAHELEMICCKARKDTQPIHQIPSKLSYSAYLRVLWQIAEKLYPTIPSDEAFTALINAHLMKCARQWYVRQIDWK